MGRDSLLDFFAEFETSEAEFVAYDDGFRRQTFSYQRIAGLAHAFADRLRHAGLGSNDKVIIWGENRAEWLVAFWGCLLESVVVVPIDYRASAELLLTVQRIVNAKAVLIGEEVAPPAIDNNVSVWRLIELSDNTGALLPTKRARPTANCDAITEVIFTSGATAAPKGVVITHGNLLANIVPVEQEVKRYRAYGRPFSPLRFLNLLPLSHMFGQVMATFIPPMLTGSVTFMRGYNPVEIIRQIRSRRISVLACVPKILHILRKYVIQTIPEVADAMAVGEPMSIPRRWWRYRAVHRLFGFKFWSFVVGAAPLDPELEAFWSRLGFLVIQGYGLTETAPIVTLNHPFRSKRGTVGRPIAGVQVKLATDGEILVRGDNVTSGYYEAPDETAASFTEDWFHTGDIGTLDTEGWLSVRGRKKEVIVTSEGLNIFPDDIERVLNHDPDVSESAIVGTLTGGEERVHAVLVLNDGKGGDAVVRRANGQLEDHQKIQGVSVWPTRQLPRTEGTKKLKRREIRQWVAAGGLATSPAAPKEDGTVEGIVASFAQGRTVSASTTLDELGLSSLERIELLMALGQQFDVTIDEMAFAAATTVSDLRPLVDGTGTHPQPGTSAPKLTFPAWNRHPISRAVRRLSLPTWILPVSRLFMWLRVDGRQHLDRLTGPVIFAANHQSHLDTPAILSALSARWRYRVAPAMAKEFFRPHFFPAEHSLRTQFTNGLKYYLAALFFNAFPLPQREAGIHQTLRYIGELVSQGYCPLIFPEGRRVGPANIEAFQPGIGMIAARLDVPVVPVRLFGTGDVLSPTNPRVRPGQVRAVFGAPLTLRGKSYASLARRVEEAVRELR